MTTRPDQRLADVLEKDWQKQVRKLADMLGYRRAYHTFDSRRSDTGFPDLVLVHPAHRRVVYLELKREHGRVTPAQAAWIRDLHHAGAEVYLARPRHLQTLATVLSAPSVKHADAHLELLAEIDPIINVD